jgi:hypothetical protein
MEVRSKFHIRGHELSIQFGGSSTVAMPVQNLGLKGRGRQCGSMAWRALTDARWERIRIQTETYQAGKSIDSRAFGAYKG